MSHGGWRIREEQDPQNQLNPLSDLHELTETEQQVQGDMSLYQVLRVYIYSSYDLSIFKELLTLRMSRSDSIAHFWDSFLPVALLCLNSIWKFLLHFLIYYFVWLFSLGWLLISNERQKGSRWREEVIYRETRRSTGRGNVVRIYYRRKQSTFKKVFKWKQIIALLKHALQT